MEIRRHVALLALSVTALAAPAAPALAATPPYVTTHGVNFVNRHGSPVILRGVDMSARAPLAGHVVDLGANFARLRVFWNRVEPGPGAFDAAELARIQATVDELARHRVFMELDLRGRPAPAWFGSTQNFFGANRRASQAAYLGFAAAVVRRFDTNPWVIGYGIFNEPGPYSWHGGGLGSPRLSRRMLSWQAGIRDGILRIDPYRAVFLNVRGGNYGVRTCFSCAGFRLAHTVIDWHDFYNGLYGTGMDETADNWLPSWEETHNQRHTEYLGTIANQWANLAIPWARSRELGIPMIVGEWGVRNDDVNGLVYDEQMERLFDRHGLSWARWDMDGNSVLGLLDRHGALNAQGVWLQKELTGRD
jgi:cellulase (glycosyl hydrolase family 5)